MSLLLLFGGPTVSVAGSRATEIDNLSGLRLTGASGSYAYTPDPAYHSTEIDLRIYDVAPNNWASGTQCIISKWYDSGNQREWNLDISGTGLLQFSFSTSGANATTRNSTVTLPSIGAVNGSPLSIWVTFDLNDGAGNNVVKFYYSWNRGETWTQLGATVSNVGTGTLFNSTAPITVGARNDGTGFRFTGSIGSAEVRTGLTGGTLIANPDFVAQADAAASFSDGVGNTWSVNSPAAIFHHGHGTLAQDVTLSGSRGWEQDNIYGLYLPGTVTTSWAETPDHADLDFSSTDMEGEFDLTCNSSFTHAFLHHHLVSKTDPTNVAAGGYYLDVDLDGSVRLAWGDGSYHEASSTVSLTSVVSLRERFKLKWTFQRNVGGVYNVKFYVDTGAGFVQLGSTIVGGAVGAISATTEPMRIGADTDGTNTAHKFIHHVVTMRNGVGGTAVFNADFTDKTKWPNGATSGTDTTTGKAITLGASAVIYQNAGKPAVTVQGQRATETDTANAGASIVSRPGTQASETDTGLAGSLVVFILGGRGPPTNEGRAGSAVVTVQGSRATETDAAFSGAPRFLKVGTQGTEADTAFAGSPRILKVGTQATETDTAFTGTALVRPAGQQAQETDAGQAGVAAVTSQGQKATESDSATSGAPAVAVQGSRSTESDTAFAGEPYEEGGDVFINGSQAQETDTASAGAPLASTQGSLATETDTANTGSVTAASTGQRATETDTAFAGTAAVTVQGTLSTETDFAFAGVDLQSVIGSQATETDDAFGGSFHLAAVGVRATETDTALAGFRLIYRNGSLASEMDRPGGHKVLQVKYGTGTGTNPSLSFDSPTTPGSLLVAVLGRVLSGSDTVTDPLGWDRDATDNRSANERIIIASKRADGTETDVTFGHAFSTLYTLTIYEVAGVVTSGPHDIYEGTSTTSVATTTLDLDTTEDDQFAVAAVFLNGTVTVGNAPVTRGWSLDSPHGASQRTLVAHALLGEAGEHIVTFVWTTGRNRTSVASSYLDIKGAPFATVDGSQVVETDSAFSGGVSVFGSMAEEADSALAGAATATVQGSLATESNSAAGGVAAVTVAGSLATETDSAAAGAASAIVQGSQATETDEGRVGSLSWLAAGAQAAETDSAFAGAAAVLVQGSRAEETDSAANGSAAILVQGSRAVETDEARAGSPSADVYVQGSLAEELDSATSGAALVLVAGTQATETDTGVSGSATVVVQGQRANETDSAAAGTATAIVQGSRADEVDTANTGALSWLATGARATETDTASAGSATAIVAGAKAAETDNGQAGAATAVVQGSLATETDTGQAGSALGALATETDTGQTGAPSVTVQGQQAVESDSALGGAASATVQGALATETDEAFTGSSPASYQGQQATETDTPGSGAPAITWQGQRSTETDTAFAGAALGSVLGAQALESDTTIAGTSSAVVTGTQSAEADTVQSGSAQAAVGGLLASETDEGQAGAAQVVTQGQQAQEDDSGISGSGADVVVFGDRVIEVDSAFAGIVATSYLGGTATEVDEAFPGTYDVPDITLICVVVSPEASDRLMVLGAQDRRMETFLAVDRAMGTHFEDRSMESDAQERDTNPQACDGLTIMEDA